ncbi:MAG: copper chaperone PCu(A)C [Gammaproteobacteria bacterium]|nr:copper chaperone PCu(A)C [Gammaproteobacteria bacterium]
MSQSLYLRLITMLYLTLFFSIIQQNVWAGSHGANKSVIKIMNPYVRAVPPGQQNSASFMQLINNSGNNIDVISAESDISKVVELHTHTMHNGMMQMRQIEKIAIPANGKTVLKPGGLHVMLIGLKSELKIGQMIEIKLNFSDGSGQKITAPVKEIMMKGMMKHKMDHKMNHGNH